MSTRGSGPAPGGGAGVGGEALELGEADRVVLGDGFLEGGDRGELSDIIESVVFSPQWVEAHRAERAQRRAQIEALLGEVLGCQRILWLEHGFLRVKCDACQAEKLVAFSCKRRGFCPSCGGRRMTERAAHLVDQALPRAPVRQWVLSLPFELRYRLAWDHRLCRAVLAVYTRALRGFYRKRAKASGHRGGRTGTVTVIQRFGGALNLNVHFHTLAVDGVFVREPDGSLSFAAAKAPTDEEVEALLVVIRSRILRLLVRRGLLSNESDEGSDEEEAPPLHALYAASVRQRVAMGQRAGATVLRLGDAPTANPAPPKGRRQARLGGFDLHANTSVRAKKRPKLERLCR